MSRASWCGRGETNLWGKLRREWSKIYFVVEQNLRFQGQYADRETGLYYNTFRYYDPVIGHFTMPDPIGLAGGLNLYQYAPNPLGWIDPLGLSCISNLPSFKGKSINWIQKILRKFGFNRTNPGNPKNQRWVHSDGSEVQIHAYGNKNTTPYKAGNNAHAHKSVGKHGESGTIELADDGITVVNSHSSDAHIGIRNPKDFPSVSGRNHGD